MGNKISIPSIAVKAHASNSNACRKIELPTEIWFKILTFVKFFETPNIFLVNRDLYEICQVYFHSGTVGQNKSRIIRDLSMELKEGSLTISVKRDGTWQSVPVPEVDPPKIFNAFGHIAVEKCCRIEAMQFLHKFQSLLTKENNVIIFERNFFVNTANTEENEKQTNSNSPNNVVVDEKQFFLNWIEQKELWLELFDPSSKGLARCLADEPMIAGFNGRLSIEFENEKNLCGLEEDAKLIYEWISTADENRILEICHYDAQKALELACKIALLFEQAHVNKTEAEKMELIIILPKNKNTVVPLPTQKVCNGKGDQQLATLRTFSVKLKNEIYASAYIFYTKPLEYLYENKEVLDLISRKTIYFL